MMRDVVTHEGAFGQFFGEGVERHADRRPGRPAARRRPRRRLPGGLHPRGVQARPPRPRRELPAARRRRPDRRGRGRQARRRDRPRARPHRPATSSSTTSASPASTAPSSTSCCAAAASPPSCSPASPPTSRSRAPLARRSTSATAPSIVSDACSAASDARPPGHPRDLRAARRGRHRRRGRAPRSSVGGAGMTEKLSIWNTLKGVPHTLRWVQVGEWNTRVLEAGVGQPRGAGAHARHRRAPRGLHPQHRPLRRALPRDRLRLPRSRLHHPRQRRPRARHLRRAPRRAARRARDRQGAPQRGVPRRLGRDQVRRRAPAAGRQDRAQHPGRHHGQPRGHGEDPQPVPGRRGRPHPASRSGPASSG